jgi:hypothetical protein
MGILFDKFETKGTKSLQTVNMMLGKSFVNKNSILTEYLFSTGILFNFNNLFKNFKYGFGSIMESMKIKKKHSLLMIPKQIIDGSFRLVKPVAIWIKSVLNPIRKLLNMVFLPNRIQVNMLSDFEVKTKNNLFLFNTLTEQSKKKFQNSFYNSKHIYFLSRRCMNLGN